ncbi:MAG: hypothetical protein F4107_13300 [Gemmatimonadetes bacterium]|nr:hypothetical protein [Gemmatimonadota bacterium]MYI66892.1 hypothetical protein [Gemmatimonadota bacterium]
MRCAAAFLSFGIVAAPLAAQDSVSVRVVPDSVTCGECSLQVTAIVEIGDRDGPGILGEQAHVARADDGDYYAFSFMQMGRLLRFSPEGEFQEAIGRTGEGPGEYITPALLRGTADSLTILDTQGFRLTTIRGGEVATWTVPFVAGTWAFLPGGRHVFNGMSFEPDRAGYPLHVYDLADRRVTHSFGGEGDRVDQGPGRRQPQRRLVAAAADGNVWAAHGNRYRIDKWSPDGDRIARIDRDAPWFRPWEEWPGLDYEVRPEPAIVGVRDWGDGILMVVVRVPDANWRPIEPTLVPLPDHETVEPMQEHELYDTVIEILDTRSGTVLGRTQVDVRVDRLIGQDGFYSYAEHSEMGEAKYIVWSVDLSG